MNIVILQGAFFPIPPLLGGAVEKRWFKLGQVFARSGHQVTHISRQYPGLPDEETIEGVLHIRVAGFSEQGPMLKHNLLDAIYSWRAVKAIPNSADVIITNSFWSPIFLRGRKKPVVYVDVARMPKGQMRFYSRADRLRANSHAVVTAIKAELPAAEHARIGMIPNPLPFDVQELVDFDAKEPLILFCGRIHSEKGLELLAKAVVNTNLENWKIQIVGPWDTALGGSGESYKKYLSKCFGNCAVEFLGPIFDVSKLNAIYRKAAVFVYPSLAEKGESFGLAPLEAMAWGAVPVVSDLTCFKDFITYEKNGLIFNHRTNDAKERLAHCIVRLIKDIELRRRLAENALDVRKTHSPEAIAELFLADFKKLMI